MAPVYMFGTEMRFGIGDVKSVPKLLVPIFSTTNLGSNPVTSPFRMRNSTCCV